MSSDDTTKALEPPVAAAEVRVATDEEFAAYRERTRARREQAMKDGHFDIETYRERSGRSRRAL